MRTRQDIQSCKKFEKNTNKTMNLDNQHQKCIQKVRKNIKKSAKKMPKIAKTCKNLAKL